MRCASGVVTQFPPGSSGPGKRILLVDDDPTVRDSLNEVLVAEGYSVIQAENGQQALDLANQLPVDLVLLDLNMPVKNGMFRSSKTRSTGNWLAKSSACCPFSA